MTEQWEYGTAHNAVFEGSEVEEKQEYYLLLWDDVLSPGTEHGWITTDMKAAVRKRSYIRDVGKVLLGIEAQSAECVLAAWRSGAFANQQKNYFTRGIEGVERVEIIPA